MFQIPKELPEEEKEYDRNTSVETLKFILVNDKVLIYQIIRLIVPILFESKSTWNSQRTLTK